MSGLVVCLTRSQRFLFFFSPLCSCSLQLFFADAFLWCLSSESWHAYWRPRLRTHTDDTHASFTQYTLYKQQHFPRSQMTDTYQQRIHSLFLRTHCAHQGYPLQTAAALSLPVNMTWNPLIKANQDTFHPRSVPFLCFNVIFLLVSVNWGAFQDFKSNQGRRQVTVATSHFAQYFVYGACSC